MSTLELTLVIASLTMATVLTRSGMLIAGERFRMSEGVGAALRFAPACALAALVLPEIVSPGGNIDLTLANPRWPAALAAMLFLLWKYNIAWGIVIGMLVYAFIRLL